MDSVHRAGDRSRLFSGGSNDMSTGEHPSGSMRITEAGITDYKPAHPASGVGHGITSCNGIRRLHLTL